MENLPRVPRIGEKRPKEPKPKKLTFARLALFWAIASFVWMCVIVVDGLLYVGAVRGDYQYLDSSLEPIFMFFDLTTFQISVVMLNMTVATLAWAYSRHCARPLDTPSK